MQEVTATPLDLLRQATYTADMYMVAAVENIDKKFGDGYAKKHPELVAAFIKVCCMDYNNACKGAIMQDSVEIISDSINSIMYKGE